MGKWFRFVSGMVVGALLCAGFTATAWAGSGVLAERVSQQVCLDGRQVALEGYLIEGNNYIKLRDIGKLMDFNVYWEDGVFIDSAGSYTGQPPEEMVRTEQVPLAGAPAEEADGEAVRQEIIRLTNELRKDGGLPALAQDELLMEAAQVRAEEMAATGEYSHLRPDGSKRTTVTDCPYTTENIHKIRDSRMKDAGQELAATAVKDWAASKVHLEGILDTERSAIGVGVAKGVDPETGKECWYCVQWFLRTGYSVTWVDEPILKSKK